jgi:hypothetical protein
LAEIGGDRSRDDGCDRGARRDRDEVIADDQPTSAVPGDAAEQFTEQIRRVRVIEGHDRDGDHRHRAVVAVGDVGEGAVNPSPGDSADLSRIPGCNVNLRVSLEIHQSILLNRNSIILRKLLVMNIRRKGQWP